MTVPGFPQDPGSRDRTVLGFPERSCSHCTADLELSTRPCRHCTAVVESPETSRGHCTAFLGFPEDPCRHCTADLETPESSYGRRTTDLGFPEDPCSRRTDVLGFPEDPCRRYMTDLGFPEDPCSHYMTDLGFPERPCSRCTDVLDQAFCLIKAYGLQNVGQSSSNLGRRGGRPQRPDEMPRRDAPTRCPAPGTARGTAPRPPATTRPEQKSRRLAGLGASFPVCMSSKAGRSVAGRRRVRPSTLFAQTAQRLSKGMRWDDRCATSPRAARWSR